MPPPTPGPDPKKNEIDIGKILLPKKEGGPSAESAQRINAGALLAQEQTAASAGIPAEVRLPEGNIAPGELASEKVLGSAVPQPEHFPQQVPPAPASQIPPPPKKEESQVQAIETYTSDINRVVKEGDVSSVSIAAAEAERRSKASLQEPIAPGTLAPQEKQSPVRLILIIAGVFLIVAGLGLSAVLFLKPSVVVPPQTTQAAPLLTVDQTLPVPISPPITRDQVMTSLETAREQVNLSLGLVGWLEVAIATTSSQVTEPMPAQQFFSIIAPNIPQDLLRSIEPDYLVGVHSYDENQPFLIFRVDSYQQGYSGLLEWEQTMQQELSPLFTRHPSPHLPAQDTASTTATTTEPEFIKTGFTDQVVENHDARVILNDQGDILLLWTFLDRNTVIITTNDATLREVIRRVTTSSVVPQPVETQ